MTEKRFCPCGSGKTFLNCCGRYINQNELPSTAEILMRSRYTAFVLCNENYLLQTWHSTTRPENIEFTEELLWSGLKIIRAIDSGAESDAATVEFIAHYKLNGRLESLHETSRFLRENGEWYYLDGDIHETKIAEVKISRNAACPCGSGKKYKRCCGR